MKWINAEQQATVTIYDEEHEEYFDKKMTVEEMLDTYTNRGYPTMYINQERNKGKWIRVVDKAGHWVWECEDCKWQQRIATNFCPDCGAEMNGDGEE